MTTESLRKVITVTAWSLTEIGLTISYTRTDSMPIIRHLILSFADTLRELSIVGSVDEIEESTTGHHAARINGTFIWYSQRYFHQEYKICQWEALSIAIRHEEGKELANDMSMLEIDSALAAINH
jgi:hypothetical protein